MLAETGGQPSEITGLLRPETHAYYPEFVNALFGELEAWVPVKTKWFMDKMPYAKIGEKPGETVVVPGWVGAPYWEKIGAIVELGNAASHAEQSYPSLTSRRILVVPDIEGRSDQIARIPLQHADGWTMRSDDPQKVMEAGEAVFSEMTAQMLGVVGHFTDVIYMDPHSRKVIEYMDRYIPNAVPLTAIPLFAEYVRARAWNTGNTVVHLPDLGSIARGELLATLLDKPVSRGDKYRPGHNKSEVTILNGGIDQATVITIDDRADTVGTIAVNLEKLKQMGADKLYVLSTHGIWSGPAIARLKKAFYDGILDGIAVTNTLPSAKMVEILKAEGYDAEVLDVRPIFIRALKHLLDHQGAEVDTYDIKRFIFRPDDPAVVERRLVER